MQHGLLFDTVSVVGNVMLHLGTNFALRAHCGHTAGALQAHVSKTTQRRWGEETSSNTCGCSNTREQSDSQMSEILIENAYRHTTGIVGNKLREMG